MAAFDPATAQPEFDPSTAVAEPPPPPRSALGEIGTGLERGVLVGLPKFAGQVLQYASPEGSTVNQFGRGMVESANKRGQRESLQAQPQDHNVVTNALASGAEMLPTALGVPLAIGGGIAALPVELPTAAVVGTAAVGAGALFGAQAGQETLNKAQEKGVDPEAAKQAARLNAASTFAAQTGMGLIGGKLFGLLGQTAGKIAGVDAGELAASTLSELTGQNGVVKPFLKALPATAAEAVGVNAAQSAATAGIERSAGIDDQSPVDAAIGSIGPTLGLTALAGPMGLVTRGMQVRSAQARTMALADGQTDPAIRTQLAQQYAERIGKVNPDAATAFLANAKRNIDAGHDLPVDASLFDTGFKSAAEQAAEQANAAAATGLRTGQPDTGVADRLAEIAQQQREQANVDAASGLRSGPPDTGVADRLAQAAQDQTEQDATAGAALRSQGAPDTTLADRLAAQRDLTALHAQVVQGLQAAGQQPAQPLSRAEFAKTTGAGLKGQALARAYAAYLAHPETQKALMARDAEAFDALQQQRAADEEAAANQPRNPQPQDEPFQQTSPPPSTAMAQAMQEALRRRDETQMLADAAAQKQRELDAIANVSKGAQLADAAARGEVTQDANAPKGRDELVSDWHTAMVANDMDTKTQARVPFEKKIDALGLDGMKTHQEQVDAVATELATNKKLSTGMRDRLTMLLDQWGKDGFTPTEKEKPAEAAATAVEKPVEKPGEAAAPAPVEKTPDVTQGPTAATPEPAAQPAALAPAAAAPPAGPAGAPAAAAPAANESKFTPEQQSVLTELESGRGGRTTVLGRLRDKVAADFEKALRALPDDADEASYNALMGPLQERSALLDSVEGEALSRDRADRAAKQQLTPEEGTNLEDTKPAEGWDFSNLAGPTDLLNPNPITHMLQVAADKVAQLRTEMNGRVRAGEQLSPLEMERKDDLDMLARTIQRMVDDGIEPRHAEYAKYVARFLEMASKPYEGVNPIREGDFKLRLSNSEEENPLLLAPAIVGGGRVVPVLENLAKNGSSQFVRDMAAKLAKDPRVADTTIAWAKPPRDEQGNVIERVTGRYSHSENHIEAFMPSEATILHEATHAATMGALHEASRIEQPRSQREAQLKSAYQEIEAVRRVAAERLAALPAAQRTVALQHGLSDAHEFVAELHGNADFREFLKSPGGLWSRALDAVRRLLGMSPREGNLLERAIDASAPFWSDTEINRTFDASPRGAGAGVDMALRKTGATYDDIAARTAGAGLKIFGAFLPLRTTNNIAHGAMVNPELRASGFAQFVAERARTNQVHDAAVKHLIAKGSVLTNKIERLSKSMEPSKWTALDREMATIGMEASRLGFDYRKNFKDNLALSRDLAQSDKPYIDELHRRYTQLQRTNPEAAGLLDEGMRANSRSLTEWAATVSANLMDAYAGRARVLEEELRQMAPAERAAATAKNEQLRLANIQSLMASVHARRLDFMDPTLQGQRNPDPSRYADGVHAEMSRRLTAAFAAARALPEGLPLKAALGEIERIHSQGSKNPYFSLGRTGDYFVKVRFQNVDARINQKLQDVLARHGKVAGDLTRPDEPYAFFRVEGPDEARALHDQLVTAGEGRVVDTAWNLLADRPQEAMSAVPALRKILETADDLNLSQAAKDAIARQVLQMMPETSSRSAKIARKGISGYDAKFYTPFAQRLAAAAHDTAGLYTSRRYADTSDGMKQSIEQLSRTGSADARQRAQLIADEFEKRYANMLTPVPNGSKVGLLNSLSHAFYLGLSPAFYIRTFAQPWHRGLPYIGAKFGFAGAMGEIAKAQLTSMQVIKNSVAAGLKQDGAIGIINAPVELKGLNLSLDEQKFVDEAHARGVFQLGETEQLLRAAMPGQTRRMQDALRMASATAQYSEMSNRFAMGLAAYRLAKKNPGKLGANLTATEYALQAIELTMDDFSPFNTARAIGRQGFAGNLTPLFTQFSNYNLQTIQQIHRTLHDGLFGGDTSPEGLQRAKESRREFGGLMATTAVISGALGLPFANAFAGVFNSLLSDKDDPKDVRVSMRNWASETFGHEVGGILMHGLPHAANLDSSTFGLESLLPMSEFLANRRLWKDRADAQVRSSMGPAISLGLDLGDAISKMSDGYWMKGIEAALPVGLRTYYKTAEMAGLIGPGGYTDSKGNPEPMKAGAGDLAWRALGFQTAQRAEVKEAQRDFLTNQELLKHRKQVVQDQFVKGVRDPAAMQSAMSATTAFNAKNPMQPILQRDILGAIMNHERSYAVGEMAGSGVPLSKRQLLPFQQQERFAAMPQP